MFFVVILSILVLDQITKYIASTYLQPEGTIPVINKIFYLTYVENRGAAFGIMQGKVWFLIAVTTLVIVIVGYYVYKNPDMTMPTKYSIALIIGGAIGNLIDRIRLGYVVDFFDFVVWPVFNMADISVVIGTSALVLILLFDKQKVGM